MSTDKSEAFDILASPESWAQGHSPRQVLRLMGDATQLENDALIEEMPISLEWNGQHHVTMIATPTELEAYAIGLSITEGIIERADQIESLDVVPTQAGIGILMTIAPGLLERVAERRREFATRGSCGLCGIGDLRSATALPAPVAASWQTTPAAVARAMAELQQRQPLNDATGAAHAAAFASPDGAVLLVTEDAGRHNALDKLVGKLAQAGIAPASGMLCLTSRAGMDIVHKAARAGFPVVCAMSAATALAARLADATRVTLVAFVRGTSCVALTHAARMVVR
jgi:FdhD protein